MEIKTNDFTLKTDKIVIGNLECVGIKGRGLYADKCYLNSDKDIIADSPSNE